MPRSKDTDYLALSAAIRAMESRMLTGDMLCRLAETRTIQENLNLLADWGYPEMTPESADSLLAERRADIMARLGALTPVKELVGYFRIEYDYHNLKAILKADALGMDPQPLLSDLGRVGPHRLTDALLEGPFTHLPRDMAAAAVEGREVLASTGSGRMLDMALDRACYDAMGTAAEESQSSFLMNYHRLKIDSVNLRSASRICRLGRNRELLKMALIPGGNIPAESILAQASAGDVTDLKKESDGALEHHLQMAGLTAFGDAVVVSFIAAMEREQTAIRTTLAGKRYGLELGQIKERSGV